MWWLASIIGLERELVSHIDKLQGARDTFKPQSEEGMTRPQDDKNTIPQEHLPREVSTMPRDLTEDERIEQVLDCTEQYLRESKRLREIAALKISRQTATGRVKPSGIAWKSSKKRRRICKVVTTNKGGDCSKTKGIDSSEISRRKAADDCLRCGWPSDRKCTSSGQGLHTTD